MIYHFALIIALLCLEPSRVDSMYFGNVLRDTVGHNPLFEAQNIEHVGLMSEQASQKIHESYLKSDKRLILLGDDGTIKPSMSENSAYDQWRIKRALKKLSKDSKNEVWIVTDKDVGVLEKDYGRIRGLHLAGYKGTQLGRKSALGMILPQPGPITELRDEANRIATDLRITGQPVSQNDYFIEYAVPMKNSQVAVPRYMKEGLMEFIKSNEKYKDYGVEVTTRLLQSEYRVVIGHQEHFNKGRLAKELFQKQEQDQKSIKFGLSIGAMPMDEPMHLAMRERGHHGIVVKSTDYHTAFPWPTHASHRMLDYRESIDLLEKLAGTRNWENRVVQSLMGIWNKIKLSLQKLK